MAKLRTYKSIVADDYTVTFVNDPDALGQSDILLMQKFGEPEINVGGTFLSGGDQFVLPDQFVKIRSGFPYTTTFDATQPPFNTNTLTKVNGYITAITTSFTTAFSTLRANSDAFSGESVTNI